MTYAEAIQFLYRLQTFGMNPGLETTRTLARQLGNPQEQLRFIHVAGTNGKGSTCAMLESIYRSAGFKVGLYTSPHLVSFRERIQVNRQLIPQADVVRLVTELRPHVEAFPQENHPTVFETVTVMALKYFAEQQCDLVIWETGLGGRLDATNIVTPLASVITNIGLDHTQWLGETLAKIAGEKAGIIKPGVPVLTACHAPEALAVITAKATELNAPLTKVSSANQPAVPLPLAGEHQQENAALAMATVQALQAKLPVKPGAIQQGLAQLSWPGRFQVVHRSGQTIVIDGAHNPDGIQTLLATLRERFPQQRPTLILGMMGDKDRETVCRLLVNAADEINLVPMASERAAKPAELAELIHRFNSGTPVHQHTGLSTAFAHVQSRPLVAVAGSLYLVGEALQFLGFGEGDDERALNDWKTGPSAR